jgi:hypothetical protein
VVLDDGDDRLGDGDEGGRNRRRVLEDALDRVIAEKGESKEHGESGDEDEYP